MDNIEVTRKDLVNYLQKIFGENTHSLREEIIYSVERTKEIKKIIDFIYDNIEIPIEITSGIYSDAVDELDYAEIENRPINLDFVGDFCVSFEIILTGPQILIRELEEYTHSKNIDSVKAEIMQVWMSTLLPLYTYDEYTLTYSKVLNTWQYSPEVSVSGKRNMLKKNIFSLIRSNGFAKIGKRLCANEVDYLNASIKKTTVFDLIFTDVNNGRLVFSSKGFKTKYLKLGWGEKLMLGNFGKIFPDIEISWQEETNSKGRMKNRTFFIRLSKNQKIEIIQDSISSVKVKVL